MYHAGRRSYLRKMLLFMSIFCEFDYKSQPYAEAMAMRPAVSYIPRAKYLRGKTGNIISFTQFEDGNLLLKTRDSMEISNKYDDN